VTLFCNFYNLVDAFHCHVWWIMYVVVVVAMLCKCWVCVELALILFVLLYWYYGSMFFIWDHIDHGNTSLLHGMFTPHQSL